MYSTKKNVMYQVKNVFLKKSNLLNNKYNQPNKR